MSSGKRRRLLVIRWLDAQGSMSPWSQLSDLDTELVPILSVGFVVEETRDRWVLVADQHDEQPVETVGRHISIPKAQGTVVKEWKV